MVSQTGMPHREVWHPFLFENDILFNLTVPLLAKR